MKKYDEEEPKQNNFGIPFSFQRDDLVVSHLLTHEKTSNGSSVIFYRECGKIPFEWEIQPGKSKNTPDLEFSPVLSPPPAVESARIARQHHRDKLLSLMHDSTNSSTQCNGCFFKPLLKRSFRFIYKSCSSN